MSALSSVILGVMALLRPLLLDNVPSIQQSAALALGRLANYSDELAEAVVSNEILPQLVYSLSEQNVSKKVASMPDSPIDFQIIEPLSIVTMSNRFSSTLSTEILQEGRCLRAPLRRQALASPRQGCRALWRPRRPRELP